MSDKFESIIENESRYHANVIGHLYEQHDIDIEPHEWSTAESVLIVLRSAGVCNHNILNPNIDNYKAVW